MQSKNYTALWVAISTDGALLATFSQTQRIMIWRLADNALLHELDGNPYPIDKLAFSADGQWLATASSPEPRGNTARVPGIIQVWAVADGRLAKTLKGPRGTTTTLAFSANSQALISANADDRAVWIWPFP